MKCGRCKKEFIPELKNNGLEYKNCKECLEKNKLKQERNKCEHNRQRNLCKECGGASICEHNRQKNKCKECGGSGICEHNRIRNQCKECGGSQICEHNRIKSVCKECGGASICEHNRIRIKCKECGGSQICEHNRDKNACKECGGSQICEHNREKTKCKECGGGSICEHNQIRTRCKECRGGSICEHNKRKDNCIVCNSKRTCKKCFSVFVGPNSKYYPYCFICFCIENPDVEIPKKYKLTEHHLRDFLIQEYKNLDLIFDRSVGDSGRRPDVLINFQNYNIIIECDENQHNRSFYECETKREMEIFQDLGNKHLVCIRFNPDSYLDGVGNSVHGCFEMTKTAGWKIIKPEWIRRINILKQVINNFISKPPTKEFNKISLFYDEDE